MKKETQKDKWRKAGLVQLVTWIPSSNKAEVLAQCEELRKGYLRSIHYEKHFSEEL